MNEPNNPKPAGRKVPPLVWIIAAIALGVVLYMIVGYGGARPLPGSEVTMPQPKPDADAIGPAPP